MSPVEERPRYSIDEIRGCVEEKEKRKASPPAVRKDTPKTPEEAGGRNNFFTSQAGKMRRAGMSGEEILAAIRKMNEVRGYETPDRELVTIARSVGSYEVGEAGDAAVLDENVRRGLISQGVRIDAVGRFREIESGELAQWITPPLLTNLIWNELRQVKKVSAEDIARILDCELYHAKRREFDKIAKRFIGKPESAEGLAELRRYVIAVSGKADVAVMGGFLQFMWCVKRSLAGLRREHDIMPILCNQVQGGGKSTAVQRLVSPLDELVNFIGVETLADERKRADLGRFVVGIWDEMEGADRRDTEAIKNALSSHEVSFRPMRTNDNQTLVRIMNFIGTSNKPLAAMVRDASGNRRFVEVETMPKLDHDTINAINYPLLWEAVSETAEAPAKAVLGEIRSHQAMGRCQDSMQLWLEFEEVEPGKWATTEEWRSLYVAWCDRTQEHPLPLPMFLTLLKREGFRMERRRMDGGKRPQGYVSPESVTSPSTDRPPTVHAPSTLKPDGDSLSDIWTVGRSKNDVKEKTVISPERSLAPSTPSNRPSSTPWPTPPGSGLELWVYDCEVFPNRFMFSAWNGTRWVEFDETNLAALAEFVRDRSKVFAGFNSHGYDDVIIGTLAADARMRYAHRIYELSCRIIEPKDEAAKDANFKDRYKGRPWAYSIDVFQLLNAKGSLKEWECRIGYPSVVESPAAFDKPLPAEMVEDVRRYCRNDVMATAEILLARWQLVELRETLADQFDLGKRAYVLSEQGLAQATFLTLHRNRTRETSGKVRDKASAAPENQGDRLPLAQVISDRVAFTTPEFQTTLDRLRAGELVRRESWSIELEGKPVPESFTLAGCEVSIGVGGLHTVDKPGVFVATDTDAIVDLDVTSYYPSLMIGERIYPSQLGEDFLADLTTLRERRVAAKKAGDKTTADALKIVLNATFGKLNDKWSPIRSVSNAFRVTINGQCYLLMLMERLHQAGFRILSANTDGVLISAPRARCAGDLAAVTGEWEKATGLNLERTDFAKVCRRDVNAYVAISGDAEKVKTKGPFNSDSGKGDGDVVRKAAVAHLAWGTDPALTVADETDPAAFLFYQRAKNGGTLHHGATELGKTARWYAATDGQAIQRKNPDGTLATIPNAHRAALALDITGWTVADMKALDLDYYVQAAWDLIRETGVGLEQGKSL